MLHPALERYNILGRDVDTNPNTLTIRNETGRTLQADERM